MLWGQCYIGAALLVQKTICCKLIVKLVESLKMDTLVNDFCWDLQGDFSQSILSTLQMAAGDAFERIEGERWCI